MLLFEVSYEIPQTLTHQLLQLVEVLDGADHLARVAILVVVPGHDLHLGGVIVDKPLLRNGFRGAVARFCVGLFTCQNNDIAYCTFDQPAYWTMPEVYHTILDPSSYKERS